MKLRPIGKKGDLSLSINAIVILILAITVMGLGLTFIRGLFKGATEKLGSALQATELQNPPSSEKPITIDQRISASPGDKKTIQIGVFNNDASATKRDGVVPVLTTCVAASAPTTTVTPGANTLNVVTPPQSIDYRASAGYGAVLVVGKTLTPDTYICTVEARYGTTTLPGATAQFFIEVTG
jgi:hypothetical protein